MQDTWASIAGRMMDDLGVEQGEVILVRDHCADAEVVTEALLAVEQAGGTPLLQVEHAEYLERLVAGISQATLNAWDLHRQGWVRQASRVLILTGGNPVFDALPQEKAAAWRAAYARLGSLEEELKLPMLIATIPTRRKADQLGMAQEALEQHLLPALAVSAERLRQQIQPVLEVMEGGQEIMVCSGANGSCTLRLQHGNRPWLADDGRIDPADRERGAIVANLPGGAIYTTVIESATEGELWLPRAEAARDVRLTFVGGRVSEITAQSGAEALWEELRRHSGEPGRVSHIGLGLNPALSRPIGWEIVDEHIQGNLLICLGENRYMGGQNASSLNVDYTIPGATLLVDGKTIVENGRVTVPVQKELE